MNIPDIPELKKSMEWGNKWQENMKPNKDDYQIKDAYNNLQTLLSACQLLCDVSDSLPPKKEITKKSYDKCTFNSGYNLAREEILLWLTKKLMGVEWIIEQNEKSLYDSMINHDGWQNFKKVVASAIIQSFGIKNNE